MAMLNFKIKPRQVNIELLRCIAMLMVLTVHANFMGVGHPTAETLTLSPITETLRVMLQSGCIVAVNVFVMISGWFGIHPSLKGFFKFMWQVVYIIAISLLIRYVFFGAHISVKDILQCFGLFGGGGWFVAAYIGLYILAPVLNAFIKQSSIRQHSVITIVFIAFEVIFGDGFSAEFIVMGYSAFSFIGLYLLAALLHRIDSLPSVKVCLLTFFICTATNAVIYIGAELFDQIALRDLVLNYINPLVITASAALLIIFTQITPPRRISRCISALAISCFAVYLLHVGSDDAFRMYCQTVNQISRNCDNGFISLSLVVGFIFAVYLGAIVIDQPRKLIWNKWLCRIFR